MCHAQVIYVVGVLKKRLAIPRHSPQVLRTLIPACWQDDPDLRPTFQTVFPLLQVYHTMAPSSAVSCAYVGPEGSYCNMGG